MQEKLILFTAIFSIVLTTLIAVGPKKPVQISSENKVPNTNFTPINFQNISNKPATPNISTTIPDYLPYNGIVSQLKTWNQEAVDLTEVNTYGTSTGGHDICYIKVTNEFNKNEKDKIMITACIHGNEPLSASVVMGYIGTLLANYGRDEEITTLLDTKEICFVPVVSPDSYPNNRHVDGVDPNRDFANKESKSVREIQEFVLEEEFDAIVSAHTFGRVYLTPWGDKVEKCPHESIYQSVIGEMCQLSGYKKIRAVQMYDQPIFGSEVDWYYRNGAFSIVMEMGTHQNIPSKSEINKEFNMTFKAILCFIKKAPSIR